MSQNTATVFLSPEQALDTAAEKALGNSDWITGQNARELNKTDVSKSNPLENIKPAAVVAPRKRGEFSKQSSFDQLVGLIANITESYTVIIFEANNKTKSLKPFASHSLSRELIDDVEIGFGSGLVGWTAENKVRISVCPFERDATTLQYYSCDQTLKSFIAVPVMDARNPEVLVGVIACDSKKSYAYSKMAEKVLLDCAEQASSLFELFNRAGNFQQSKVVEVQQERLNTYLDTLRNCTEEDELLKKVQNLPQDIVESDAVVVAVSSERGMGHASFYPATPSNDVEHRLTQIVCKHKKLRTHTKSVHSLPLDDSQQRSFLSIPIRMLDTEIGSLNLLSQPHAAFTSETIGTLETLTKEIGSMLERVRLRRQALSQNSSSSLLSWTLFKERAEANLQEASRERRSLELLRISFGDLAKVLEQEAGIEVSLASTKRLARLIEQVAVPNALCGKLYGQEYLLLTNAKESSGLVSRLQRLLARLSYADVTRAPLKTSTNLGELLTKNMRVSASAYPKDAKNISALLTDCQIALYQQPGAQKAVKE